MPFISLRMFFPIPSISSISSRKGVGFSQMLFLHLLKWSCEVFPPLFSLHGIFHCLIFQMLKPTMHSWDKSNLIVVYNPFYMLLDTVCQDFLEDFGIYVYKRHWSVVFFSWYLSGYSIRVICSHRMNWEVFLPLPNFESL